MNSAAAAGQATGQVTMGRIGKVYGVQGWVKLISYSEPADNLLELRYFRGLVGGRWMDLEMDLARRQGKGFIGHFVGYDTPEDSRILAGAELAISSDQLPELGPGEYYWHQLIGMRVLTVAGVNLGEVDRLLETGANDVLVVRATENSLDNRERLIPYLPTQVVTQVSLDEKVVTVDWDPDYLA